MREEAVARMRGYRYAVEELQRRIDQVAGVARLDLGMSWAKIGAALGITQQGAMHRYTTPGAPGHDEWVALGWIPPAANLPAPRASMADLAVMGLDPFADEDPDWQ